MKIRFGKGTQTWSMPLITGASTIVINRVKLEQTNAQKILDRQQFQKPQNKNLVVIALSHDF